MLHPLLQDVIWTLDWREKRYFPYFTKKVLSLVKLVNVDLSYFSVFPSDFLECFFAFTLYSILFFVFCSKQVFIKTHVHMYDVYIKTWPITPAAAGATLRRPSSCPETISNWFSIQGGCQHPHLNGHVHLAQTPLASLFENRIKRYLYIFLLFICIFIYFRTPLGSEWSKIDDFEDIQLKNHTISTWIANNCFIDIRGFFSISGLKMFYILFTG